MPRLVLWVLTLSIASIIHAQPDDDWELEPWDPPSLERVTTVVLDPGHGGSDAGIIRGDLEEKELTLDIATEAANRIVRELGAVVVMTREDDDYVTEKQRAAIANHARADVFVSIHASASASPDLRGISVYYHSPDTRGRSLDEAKVAVAGLEAVTWRDAGNEALAKSAQLAGTLAATLTETTELPLLGIQGAPVAPLRGATMPSVLIEIGYLSNSQDAEALNDPRTRVLLADAIREAILEYDKALARN